MNQSKKVTFVVGVGTAALVGKAALPSILTWLVNLGLQKIPGYRGRVRRVQVDFASPRLMVEGLSLVSSNSSPPKHELQITSIVAGSHWKDILAGTLVGNLRIDSPIVVLNLEQTRSLPQKQDEPQPAALDIAQSWQAKVKQLRPFRISFADLTNGQLHLRGIQGQNGIDLRIQSLDLRLENITNSGSLAPTLIAKASCSARLMTNGTLQLRAEGYPLAEVPTFNADLQATCFDLTEVRSVIEENVDIDVRRGIFELYAEAAAADGRIEGYAKPVFDHLELEPRKGGSFSAKIKGWAAEAVVKLGKNQPKDRVATRMNFEGSLDDPEFNITDAVLRFFRNSFLTAERASLDRLIWFSRSARAFDEVEIHNATLPRSRTAVIFQLVKESFSQWSEDAAPRMAAALSYYTAFSMAPLLILAISVAGIVLGREAAQGKIVEQIGGLVGKQSAAAIESMIQAANRPSEGLVAGAIGIISLLAGATGVLSELKSALNKIWRIHESGNVKDIVKKNVVFLGMLLGMGFLLTVSLVMSATVSGVGKFLGGMLPAPELLLHTLDFVLSVGLTAVMFATIYKFLPDTRVEWRDVWIGGFVTSFLFNLGKLGLGLYIGKGAVGSAYGAAGSVLVLLLWVYYSGLIFYFGAEFTKVYSDRYGSRRKEKQAKKAMRASLTQHPPV